MDNYYYIWMQEIANLNEKFDISLYKNLIKKYGSIEKIYSLTENKEKSKEIDVDNSIVNLLFDDNIKRKAKNKYKKIMENKIIIIPFEKYNKRLNVKNMPFYILSDKQINLNNKNVYIFYDNYFSNFSETLLKYFTKIINEEKCNVFSEYKSEKIEILNIYFGDIVNFRNIKASRNYIILPNLKYLKSFIINMLDVLIIIQARYEKNIVMFTDMMLEYGKEVYVVPSNIFRKNSYFSNYLIKQGAQIILNKQDLKVLLNNIIY